MIVNKQAAFSLFHQLCGRASMLRSSLQAYRADTYHILISRRYWGLLIVGTKTRNSLLNQPLASLDEALSLDRKKQFHEEYYAQKVGFAAFISQFKQNWLSFPSYSKFWFQLGANPKCETITLCSFGKVHNQCLLHGSFLLHRSSE